MLLFGERARHVDVAEAARRAGAAARSGLADYLYVQRRGERIHIAGFVHRKLDRLLGGRGRGVA
jgi:hypothetical protein